MHKKWINKLAIIISMIVYGLMPATWLWAAESGFGVQVAAFKTERRAKAEADRWRKAGQATFYRHETVKKIGRWYRVYIGPFNSRTKAKNQARKLQKKGALTSFFIRSLKTAARQIKSVPPQLKKPPPQTGAGPKVPAPVLPVRSVEVKKTVASLSPTAGKVSETPAAAVAQKDPKVPAKLVKVTDIRFKAGQNDTEQVVIRFESAMLPAVRFDRKNTAPKLVVTIDGALIAKENLVSLPIDGQWIKKIEPRYESAAKRLDVSVDLTTGRHVAVMQQFGRDQKSLTLIFSSAYADEARPSNQARAASQN